MFDYQEVVLVFRRSCKKTFLVPVFFGMSLSLAILAMMQGEKGKGWKEKERAGTPKDYPSKIEIE